MNLSCHAVTPPDWLPPAVLSPASTSQDENYLNFSARDVTWRYFMSRATPSYNGTGLLGTRQDFKSNVAQQDSTRLASPPLDALGYDMTSQEPFMNFPRPPLTGQTGTTPHATD